MKSLAGFIVALAVFTILGAPGYGSIIAQYQVSSTSVVNEKDKFGNDAPHGLWTSGDSYGSGDRGFGYYDIQDDMVFTQFSNGTATLIGTAVNPYGTTATISLSFGDFLSSLSDPDDYKQEGGLAYDPDEHDFYDSVSGTIVFDWAGGSETVNIARYVGTHKFQFGLGANAKSKTEFGGSAWIQDADGATDMGSHHWDLNLQFSNMSGSGGTIPEPGTMAIWSILGAGGMVFGRFRKKKKVQSEAK